MTNNKTLVRINGNDRNHQADQYHQVASIAVDAIPPVSISQRQLFCIQCIP
jgi:hypothetical protein